MTRKMKITGLAEPKIIPREKWLRARELAQHHGGYASAYKALAAEPDHDVQVLRVLDFARHGGPGQRR